MFDPNKKINHTQKVLTKAQYDKLVLNHNNPEKDSMEPVVKFFDPFGAATWLFSELEPETGICFGLADLGMDCIEFGYTDLNEFIAIGRIERDLHFKGTLPLSEYAQKETLAGV